MTRQAFRRLAIPFFCLASIAAAHDEATQSSNVNIRKLAYLIPNLFGPQGLVLPNPTHEAHFQSAFQSNFGPFNTAIAIQLTSLPIPSPASGFTYQFDKSTGAYTRSAQSFGPILAERAETIGKDKFYFGFSFQNFRFTSLDGLDLNNVPSVFQHSIVDNVEYRKDIITTDNQLDIRLGQFTGFFTYGVSDRLDVSVAIPLITANLEAISNATIRRIGTASEPDIHFFGTTGDRTRQTFANAGSASGIGDVIVRAKGNLLRRENFGIAAGLDVRLPTGDPYDFLGSGAVGLRPFVAVSGRTGRLAPHVNLAYQWNDSSVLAGDVRTGRKGHLPNIFQWTAGADYGLTQRLTFAFDVLGQSFRSQRVVRTSFQAANNSQWPQVEFRDGTINQVNGSVGMKINAWDRLLVSFNVLFRMNDAGLRANVVPLIGLSYTF